MGKKTTTIIILIILGITGYFLINNSSKKTEGITTTSVLTNSEIKTNSSTPQPYAPADRIEVVHFHGNLQCWACKTVGEYALSTIKEKFPEEYASGIITFKDVNGELAKNRDIVIKYQARGSSLFVNVIHGDKNVISEDTTVWRLVGNEKQFTDYFEKKLKNLLGN